MSAWDSADHAALARQIGAERAAREKEALQRLADLVGIVYRLRDPDGCPWDREQTVASMSKNIVEEAHETAAAIAARDDAHVAEELGDVLMNVLLVARIAEQEGRFDLSKVASGIATKLVRRHEHVFGERQAADAGEALASWNESKAKEKPRALLASVSDGLPALALADKLGRKAAEVGFDWPDVAGALEKLEEEVGELRRAPPQKLEEELGDVLFAAVNVARKAGIDPELALRATIAKFRRRFAAVERALGEDLPRASLADMERTWRQAAAEGG